MAPVIGAAKFDTDNGTKSIGVELDDAIATGTDATTGTVDVGFGLRKYSSPDSTELRCGGFLQWHVSPSLGFEVWMVVDMALRILFGMVVWKLFWSLLCKLLCICSRAGDCCVYGVLLRRLILLVFLITVPLLFLPSILCSSHWLVDVSTADTEAVVELPTLRGFQTAHGYTPTKLYPTRIGDGAKATAYLTRNVKQYGEIKRTTKKITNYA